MNRLILMSLFILLFSCHKRNQKSNAIETSNQKSDVITQVMIEDKIENSLILLKKKEVTLESKTKLKNGDSFHFRQSWKNNESFIDSVFFFNEHENMIKAINLREENPFLHKIDFEKETGSKLFLKRINKQNLKALFSPSIYRFEDIESESVDYFQQDSTLFSFTGSTCNCLGENFAVIFHRLTTVDKDGNLYGDRGSIDIYDTNGNIVHSLFNLDVDVKYPVVTNNGKYLMFRYGGWLDEDEIILKEGYRIYDLSSSNELVLDYQIIDSEQLALPIVVGNLLFITIDKPHRKLHHLIYDLENNIKYSKLITFPQSVGIHKRTKEFISLKDYNTQETTKLYYEKYFNKEKIK